MERHEITITPEQYEHMKKLMEKEEKRKAYSRRVAIKNQIFVEKAKAAGIEVSDAEINERINNEDNASRVVTGEAETTATTDAPGQVVEEDHVSSSIGIGVGPVGFSNQAHQ